MVRTGVSGLAGTAIDVTTMILLVELAGAAAGVAAFLGASAGAGASFCLAKFWAFGERGGAALRQLWAYALVSLGTATFVAGAVHLLADVMGAHYLVAKAASAVVVFLCWSYPAQSRLVFPRPHRAAA